MQHPFQSSTILNSRRFFFVDRMKTFVQFTEDITQRRLELTTEVYDKDVMGSSQIRRTGEGGRVGADRRKTEPERRRMKAAGGGKMVPAAPYKDRKDIGTQRQKSTREQQPTQARGSAADAQKAAAKEERRKAALARAAARKSGGEVKKDTTSSKEKEAAATKLLSKKSTTAQKQPSTSSTPRRNWKTDSGGGMTRKERDSARNKEKGAALKARKAELIKNFTEKNGRPPKGVERTKLLGLAHKTVKAGV